ncbi:MAG TPA: ATP-binding cassette domain-containing protein, partial [Candidatus Limnocylindrales bacterium]
MSSEAEPESAADPIAEPAVDPTAPEIDDEPVEADDRPPVTERPVVLSVRDLHKRYGALEAVRGVSFEIHEGETYGLLGPNGAGKTTTISMVCGLLT